MSTYQVNMTYEPFSQEPEYLEANRAFIKKMDLTAVSRILDLACGIGTMSDLFFEKKEKIAVIGVDISLESLLLAKKHFQKDSLFPINGDREISFVHATADTIPLAGETVDFVIMGNSIHLLPDVNKLLSEVRRVLRPQGYFSFNSSFYAGTMPKGTEKFHHEWMKQAATYIMQKDSELRNQGKDGISRKRGTVRGAFSQKWPSPLEWKEILEKQNFSVLHVDERTVHMTQRNFETIGAYGGFAKIILSGYPIEEASEALQATAGTALQAVRMETVPRLWLEIIARKQ